MRKKPPPQYRPAVALVMAMVMLLTSLPVNLAEAARVTTDQVVEGPTAADDRARVMDFMARQDVRRELETLGIDPDEAARRTAALSDDEIRQIAGRLDELPAGQGWNNGLAIGVAAVIVVYVIAIVAIIYGVWWTLAEIFGSSEATPSN